MFWLVDWRCWLNSYDVMNLRPPLIALAFLLGALVLFVPRSAAVAVWDESVNGPLSTSAASPTSLRCSSGRVNSIISTIGGANRDYFTFNLEPTQSLVEFRLSSYVSSDPVSWIALQEGAAWTAGDDVAHNSDSARDYAHAFTLPPVVRPASRTAHLVNARSIMLPPPIVCLCVSRCRHYRQTAANRGLGAIYTGRRAGSHPFCKAVARFSL